jgi:hypothetical protein
MAFQDQNETREMKSEHSSRNLVEKSRTDRDLKWDANGSVFWIGMKCFGHSERNKIELITLVARGCVQTWLGCGRGCVPQPQGGVGLRLVHAQLGLDPSTPNLEGGLGHVQRNVGLGVDETTPTLGLGEDASSPKLGLGVANG